jgi:hypothetical protein
MAKYALSSSCHWIFSERKNMGISEDQAYGELQQHIRTIWDCMFGAHKGYRDEYPDQGIHRKSTRASIINDRIFAKVVSAFDEVPGTHIIEIASVQLRYLSLSDRVTLWFKKMDEGRQTANFQTDKAVERDNGQAELFGKAEIIVAGYVLNDDESAIKRISFTPPNDVRPHWYIDVAPMAQPIQMKGPQPIKTDTKVQLQITMGATQFLLG